MKKFFEKILITALVLLMTILLTGCNNKTTNTDILANPPKNESENKETIKGDTSNFDIKFLKMENQKANKIYSPLSIKYALKMLEEGTEGESKLQISNVLGNETLKKYNSNSNMAFANALFAKDSYENKIKNSYISTLKTKYNAEVKVDSFSSPENLNSWVSNKTLNLIKDLFEEVDKNTVFMLINALAIDMDWEDKFIKTGRPVECWYEHEKFDWVGPENPTEHKFGENSQKVSGMEIIASINNYDIVKEIGEANIRETVKNEFKKWAKSLGEEYFKQEFNKDLTDSNIEEEANKYLETYIPAINSNYKRVDYTTDFSIYVDNNIKVFAKDLKEYNGTTLQYIGIMPTTEDLDNYIKNIDKAEIDNIINKLKDLKVENFKSGVVTKITGYIPKFKFEYELNLKKDLQQLGITNIFEEGKANLTGICDDKDTYITDAGHKANIEFTQDGIKAAAATWIGGAGAGSFFDYLYDVPVEEIDLTFDKPYMFLIRDKEDGTIWFVGTVYEPLLYNEDTTIGEGPKSR